MAASTRLVVQELLEGEQGDFLGGRGRYQRRGEEQLGSRNGYERGRLRTAEGFVDVAVPQVRGAGEPFRSSLMSFLDGNSEVFTKVTDVQTLQQLREQHGIEQPPVDLEVNTDHSDADATAARIVSHFGLT